MKKIGYYRRKDGFFETRLGCINEHDTITYDIFKMDVSISDSLFRSLTRKNRIVSVSVHLLILYGFISALFFLGSGWIF